MVAFGQGGENPYAGEGDPGIVTFHLTIEVAADCNGLNVHSVVDYRVLDVDGSVYSGLAGGVPWHGVRINTDPSQEVRPGPAATPRSQG